MGKRVIKFFIALLFLGLCENTAQAQINYLGDYGGYWDEAYPDIMEGFDGNPIIFGTTNSFPQNDTFHAQPSFYVLNSDTSGELFWQINSGTEYGILQSGTKTYDGSYLFTGASAGTNVLKASESGEVLYFNHIPEGPGYVNYPFDMCITSDTNYMVCGQWASGGRILPYLQKINDSSDLIWDTWYDFENDSTEGRLVKITGTLDNGFICLGAFSSQPQLPFLIKYDFEGNVEWWKYFITLWPEDDFGDYRIYGLEKGGNGKTWLYGEVSNHQTPNPYCATFSWFSYLLELDNDGEILRRKIYCPTDTSAELSFRNIKTTTDGGVILSGYQIIQKLNADWEEEWTIHTQYDIHNAIQHSNGNYYATGEIVNGPIPSPIGPHYNTDFFLLKIAPNGTVIEEIMPQKEMLNIYPNPTTSEITIQFNQTIQPQTTIELSDMQGRLLNQSSALNQQTKFFLNYPSGIYLLTLKQKGVAICHKKLILE